MGELMVAVGPTTYSSCLPASSLRSLSSFLPQTCNRATQSITRLITLREFHLSLRFFTHSRGKIFCFSRLPIFFTQDSVSSFAKPKSISSTTSDRDSQRASGKMQLSKMTLSTQPTSPGGRFFKLPAELRNMVYGFLLGRRSEFWLRSHLVSDEGVPAYHTKRQCVHVHRDRVSRHAGSSPDVENLQA